MIIGSLAQVRARPNYLRYRSGFTADTFTVESLFANGEQGFAFDASQLDRLFQENTGQTPISADAQTVGLALENSLWGGKTFAALVAAQPELLSSGTPITYGVATAATYNTSTGVGTATRVDATNQSHVKFTVRNGLYKVNVQNTGTEALVLRNGANGGALVTTVSAGVTFNGYVLISTGIFSISPNLNTVAFTLNSLKLVPGNHGTQATSAARPAWKTCGLLRFDGSDDNLLTTLTPSAAMTYVAKAKITNTGIVLIGSGGGGELSYVGVSASGKLAAGVGSTGAFGHASVQTIQNVLGVLALMHDGTTVKLYWNGVEVYSGAQVGGGANAKALPIGGYNSGSGFSAFMAGDVYQILAINRALSAAEILNLTNLWGTT